MLEAIVTIILLIALIVAFIGATSLAMLVLIYGPGAAAGFAAGVTASRMGADPLSSIVIAVGTFVFVTGAVTQLLGLVYLGVRRLFGMRRERMA
jgi:amino acid transporter